MRDQQMPTMKGKRILTSLYLDPPVHEALKRLSGATRVPVAVYLREAIQDLLTKYDVKTAKVRPAKSTRRAVEK